MSATTESKPRAVQIAERAPLIRRAIEIYRRGTTAPIEIRALGIEGRGKPHEAAGVFTDIDKAAEAAATCDIISQPAGVYVVMNELHPSCAASSPGKIKPYQSPTASDNDIVRRRWLLIDVDPKRPSGVPSTDAELADSTRLATDTRIWLREEFGFPDPVEGMSGNGYYLLYGIDLPNDKEHADLVKAVLVATQRHTGELFAPPGLYSGIDLTTFNAARVARLFGTANRKGTAMPGLPHRLAELTVVPDQIIDVSVEKLREVAAWQSKTTSGANGKQDAKSKPSDNGHAKHTSNGAKQSNGTYESKVDVPRWLKDRNVTYREGTTAENWPAWFIECPFDASHGAHGEVYFAQGSRGGVVFKCHHNSCSSNGWDAAKRKSAHRTPTTTIRRCDVARAGLTAATIRRRRSTWA